ncbi:amidohydrolase [Sediminivirga luteola]|uniref:amidohydrolase n=1 Tax=Sediminivirga luteola TaxID=1774748 RepID=UPI001F1B677C|nr:amidohydrolase [Sediminivirga luteola]MCI2266006.1 amidohydrolase [Sediminivirga luteola]
MRLDMILDNARITTMDPARPQARRMGVLHGRIVGFDEELDGLTADHLVDAGGAPALPGFHDAHHHLSLTGARLASVNLRPGAVDTLDELYAAIARHAQELPEDAWVFAAGYDQNIIGDHPTAEGLDRAAGGRPVIAEHVSGHMIVVSTAVFERAGYSGRRDVPDVTGGYIPRDADGRAVGLLEETARQLVMHLVRPRPEEEVVRNLRLAGDQALAYGLTSVTEPGTGDVDMIGNSPLDFHFYQRAVETGAVRTRVTLMPYCTTLHQIKELSGTYGLDLGIRTGLGDERLRIGPVKILSDGSFIGRSAAMHRCYHGEPDNSGYLQFETHELRRMIVDAHRSGWTVASHAIGDAAIDHVLDAVEEAQQLVPRPGVRHRIEHFALSSQAQVTRAARLGVIPVPQGVFVSDFGDGMAAAVEPELVPGIYRLKSLLNAGIVLPGSTDSPVSDANPLRSIGDMVNRRTASGMVLGADERLTAEEAVRAYTYGSAYAAGREQDLGTLERGKLADVVLLSDDIFSVAPERIATLKVGATIVGGELLYNEAGLAVR